jgi:non-ribosomal peptide synthetase component F
VLDDPGTVAGVGSGVVPVGGFSGVGLSAAAYVVFTSGSTGRPKGVVVSYAGLMSLGAGHAVRLGVGGSSRVLQFASAGFDLSVADVVTWVWAGAVLVVTPVGVGGGVELAEVVDRFGVTHAMLPVSVLASVPVGVGLGSLSCVAVGGEPVRGDVVARWASGRRMINGYGPTEATVTVTMSDPLVPAAGRDGGGAGGGVGEVPIGRPLDNVRVFVLDGWLRPVPVGVCGELYVAGVGCVGGGGGGAGAGLCRSGCFDRGAVCCVSVSGRAADVPDG